MPKIATQKLDIDIRNEIHSNHKVYGEIPRQNIEYDWNGIQKFTESNEEPKNKIGLKFKL